MENVKSGKEILNEFFLSIQNLQEVDQNLTNALVDLYQKNKFTEANVKNILHTLRDKNGNKN